jgi:hypothetical protein
MNEIPPESDQPKKEKDSIWFVLLKVIGGVAIVALLLFGVALGACFLTMR